MMQVSSSSGKVGLSSKGGKGPGSKRPRTLFRRGEKPSLLMRHRYSICLTELVSRVRMSVCLLCVCPPVQWRLITMSSRMMQRVLVETKSLLQH